MVLEKIPESPLDSKEIRPVNLNGKLTLNTHWKDWCWSWNSIILVIWCEQPTQERSLMLLKIEGRSRGCQRMRWLDGITNTMDLKLGQTLGDGEGQRGLVCCSPWGCKNRTWLGDWTTIAIHGIYILSRVISAIQ